MRKNNQTGRSMVEMLGVLAIIGVLSVGAIAGYQKAMFKYKLNKQAQQLNQIISTGLRYRGQFSDAEITTSSQNITILNKYFIKMNEIPKEMIKDEDTIYDVFNVKLRYDYYHTEKQTTIFFFPPNNEDNYSLEICRNIIKTAKEYNQDIYHLAAISGTENSYNKSIYYYGDNYCSSGTKCIKDLTLSAIEDICMNNIGNSYIPHLKIIILDK